MSRYGVPFVKGPEVRLPPHPQSCDLQGVRDLAQSIKKPLAIDLFSGAGGLSYGLHLAGFEVILAVDKEAEAAETHRAHFPGASIHADLSDPLVLESICAALNGVQLDLVAGGPPCQPYSQAAFSKVRHLQELHGKPADPRRELWSSFLHVVTNTMPRSVIIENVPDMAFGRDSVVLRRLVHDLECAGYSVHTRVLCSDAYGVPQHRQRLFTVAFREDVVFSWPARDQSIMRLLKDAIADLPQVEGGDKSEVRPYTGVPSQLQEYYRESVPSEDRGVIYDHHTRAVRKDDLEAFKLMTSKTTYSQLPDYLKRYRDDIFEDKYKRLDMDQLSRTITAHISQDGYWYIHPIQHRTLTIREAARIQTFPDSYRFCGYPRHAFKQIGEAVPPLFGRAIGSEVLAALKMSVPATNGFKTLKVARDLGFWFQNQSLSELRLPWLASNDPWAQILGQVLFDRYTPSKIAQAYEATIRQWPTPELLLAAPKEEIEGTMKAAQYETLCRVANALVSGKPLSSELLQEYGVRRTVALRLAAIAGAGSRRPLNAALERVVKRFTGFNTSSIDGRGNTEMLLGRIVGCDPDGVIFCAVNEVAARFCGPSKAACSECPLRSKCAYHNSSHIECVPESSRACMKAKR